MRKYFRISICILMICALLVSISPLRVKAAGWEWSLVTGNPYVIGAAIIVGLGIMGDELILDGLVRKSVTALGADTMRALRHMTEAGDIRYYVSASEVEAFRSWLFDEGVVVAGLPEIPTEYMDNYNFYLSNYTYCILVVNNGKYYFSGATVPYVTYTDSNGNLWVKKENNVSLVYRVGSSTTNREAAALIVTGEIYYFGEGYPDSLSTPYDLTLGTVPTEEITSGPRTDILAEWSNRQIWVHTPDLLNGKEKTEAYYPLYLGQYEDLLGLTQDEILAQSGVLTSPGLEWEEEEKYKSDLIMGETYQELTLSQYDTTYGNPEGTFSTDMGYSFDLTKIFPFCIPFDIYEFLNILAAEPEAPVFKWVIPVPQMDQEFELTVDLSAWDNIAQLFRTLELLAFIIGLAMVTRDKILRG